MSQNDVEEIVAEARERGWVHLSRPNIHANILAHALGRIMPSRVGGPEYDILRPYSLAAAPKNSMSAVTGTEAQPLHTDGAYYPRPPQFLLFRCVDPGESDCKTVIWTLDWNSLLKVRPPELVQAGWVVRGGRIPPFYCRVLNWNSYGEDFIRFDPCCMSPPDRHADIMYAALEQLEEHATPHEITWTRGDLLLVDNCRCLHARGDGADRAPARRLERWMIGEQSGMVVEALLAKARLYIDRAHEQPIDSSLFAFWTSLSLELLCRAAVAKIHPVLLADPVADGNIFYAFGKQPKTAPKSIQAKTVFSRCVIFVDGFTAEMSEHCLLMANLRNSELHTGVAAFETLDNAAWLPATYEVMAVLLPHLGTNFEDFLGEDHGLAAQKMLADRRANLKKEVLDRISTARMHHADLGETESESRRQKFQPRITALLKQRNTLRTRTCPACGETAVIAGDIVSRGPVRIDEGKAVIEREGRVLPSQFVCPHCELTLNGFPEIREAGVGAMYTVTEEEDPVEFFGINPEDYIDSDEFIRNHLEEDYGNE